MIKPISKFCYPRTNSYHIGDIIQLKCIYRYMPLNSAIKSLENNTIHFGSPMFWKDPFESHFYHPELILPDEINFETALSALCVTSNPHCEAAWRMYTDDPVENPCVCFKIYIGQFRHYIDKFAYTHKLNVYEGKVSYELPEKRLKSIGKPKNHLTDIFFHNFDFEKYINLMLLKRPDFKYEEEIRFLISGVESGKEDLFIPIPWSQCLYSIILPPNATTNQINKIKRALEENYKICLENYSDRKDTIRRIPIEENTLYKL